MPLPFALIASLSLASAPAVIDEAEKLLAKRQGTEALELVKQEAETGKDPEVIAYLAWFYDEGVVVRKNPLRAAMLYQQAADMGDAAAQWRLGVMIDSGIGIKGSPEDAVKLFRMAAARGEPRARTSLGVMYSNGRGVARDFDTALRHYQAGAKLGDPHAFTEIGAAQYAGKGVIRDKVEATAYFLVATMLGDPLGADDLAKMFDELDAASVLRASDRAEQIIDEFGLEDTPKAG